MTGFKKPASCIGNLNHTNHQSSLAAGQNLFAVNPFAVGDSSTQHHSTSPQLSQSQERFVSFMDRLMELASGKVFPFEVILRDPLGNSFVSARLGK